MKRVIIDVAVLIVLFLLPWWASLLLIGVCMFFLSRWYEGIVFGFLVDALSAGGDSFAGFGFMMTSSAALLFIAALVMRNRLVFHFNR